MSNNDTGTTEAPTRREYVKYGGVVVGGGLLAGCTSSEGSGSTPTGEETATDARTATSDSSYSVTMAPMGEVQFEGVPQQWVAYKSGYGDMGIALGVGDGLVGTDRPDGSLSMLNERFYSQLPGFELNLDEVTNIRANGESIDKEIFYEVDADLHLMDPNLPVSYFEWEESDVEEISTNVAPFFGNFIRRARDDSWPGEPYKSYTLYEVFEKVSQVFQRQDRYDGCAKLHDEVQTKIDDTLPPAEERPSIALMNGGSDPAKGTFYAMDPTAKGYEMKQYRDLRIKNAFKGVETGQYGETDYETLLEVDPEIIIFHWGVTYESDAFQERFIQPMLDDDVAQELTAVQEGNLYPGGTAEQGPVLNLFQTEMLAQQQYPDDFGEFPGLGKTPDQVLFDRKRVADIINGDI